MSADLNGTQVRPRPEGGGEIAPALGGGSGANRAANGPVVLGNGNALLGRVGAARRASGRVPFYENQRSLCAGETMR